MLKVIVLGSGNVGSHLVNLFNDSSQIDLVQWYSRSEISHKKIEVVNNIDFLKEADVYIICVSDNAIKELSSKFTFKNKLVVHTSGSTPFQIISEQNKRGVFYPLQTFSYDSNLSFKQIPILIEANSKINLSKIKKLADIFSKKVYKMNSSKRLVCHLSATIANNFSNHMIVSAEKILEENKINKSIIKPLIFETFNKLNKMSAKDAQTGPALRNDYITIEKHVKQLVNSDFLDLYKEVTKNIKSNEL